MLEEFMTVQVIRDEGFIYFLYDGDELVYIGQTSNYLVRPLTHKDKEYNKIVLYKAPKCKIEREAMEIQLINKYKPKYNKYLGPIDYRLSKMQGYNEKTIYVNLELIKDKLKQSNRYDITGGIKVFIRKNLHYLMSGKQMYVDFNSLNNILIHNYGIDLSLKK